MKLKMWRNIVIGYIVGAGIVIGILGWIFGPKVFIISCIIFTIFNIVLKLLKADKVKFND